MRKIKNMLDNIDGVFFLDADGLARSRRKMLLGGYFWNIIINLVGGNFLTGLLLLLNAGNNYMGYLSMATLACGFLQLFSPLLLEGFRVRKTLLLVMRGLFYILNIGVLGAVPFLPWSKDVRLIIFFAVAVAANGLNALFAPGISVWHIRNLPGRMKAGFYSLQNMTVQMINYLAIVLASAILDGFSARGLEIWGMAAVRAIALCCAAMELRAFSHVKEHPYEQSENKVNLRNILLNPWRETAYLKVVFGAALWNFAANIPGPYFNMYLLNDLRFSYVFINGFNLINIPLMLIMMPVWVYIKGRLDSVLKTLCIALAFHTAGIGILSLTTASTSYFYPIGMICTFFTQPGVLLCFAFFPFLNIPKSGQTNYISFYLTMASGGAMLGVFAGKALVGLTAGRVWELFGITLQSRQLVVVLQAVFVLICAGYIFLLSRTQREDY